MYEDYEKNEDSRNDVSNQTNDRPSDRPTGGVYSGQRYEYDNENKRTFFTGDVVNTDTTENTNYYNNTATDDRQPERIQPPHYMPPKKEKKKNPFWGRFFATIGLGVLLGLTAGVTLYFMNVLISRENGNSAINEQPPAVVEDATKEVPNSAIAKDSMESDSMISNEIADTNDTTNQLTSGVVAYDVSGVAEDVMPAVVSIVGNYTVTQRDFWGQTYSSETPGSGSGIIIGKDDSELYIATNNHVVENSTELNVQFIDGKSAPARIKGTNKDIDLAVILVDLDELENGTRSSIKVAKLGDSDSLKVGETAIAIGNALGYGQSVTAGVISAVNRSLDMNDGSKAEGLIQTDAAINPGNSGGALVNINGEVIGINSSKIGGSTVDGVGFAIPISSAEPILSDIATREERVKVSGNKSGYLGIGGVSVTSEASKMYGIPVGVVVRQVYEGTGAMEAGIAQGDVIVSVEGETIESMDALRDFLEYYAAGDTVSIEFYRIEDGEYVKKTAEVRLIDKNTLQSASSKQ